jgi:hypothetical protein
MITRRDLAKTMAAVRPLMKSVGIAAFAGSSQLRAASATSPVLTEDYQVIQRDSSDKGACFIKLPDGQSTSKFHLQVVDDTGRTWMSETRQSQNGSNGPTVFVDGIPTGGPYTVELTADGNAKSRISFRNILVGDIWILGGQSNMFGAATLEESLPALPYANMLDPKHTLMDSHWRPAIPPIHRVSAALAVNQLKRRK